MNADKMFEKLKYKKLESDIKIAYTNIYGKTIMFSKLVKKISFYGKYYFVDILELQAINKKCKRIRMDRR